MPVRVGMGGDAVSDPFRIFGRPATLDCVAMMWVVLERSRPR
jgi:hypothetical protein